ncbi:ACT domain-containing protein [Desulfomarina sp.]
MSGEKSLKKLLRTLTPRLHKDLYVFCRVAGGRYGDYAEAEPIASFMESEGLTLVVKKNMADGLNLQYSGLFSYISLNVHSSLEAVGLTAAVSTRLSEHGISANIIAAYTHDHLFVPADKGDEALHLLLKFCN